MEKTQKQIWHISVFNGIAKMLSHGVNYFWAIFFSSIGFSGMQIGVIVAVTIVTGILTIIPSGVINDRLKSKNLVTISMIMMGVQFIGVSYLYTFPAVIVFSILGGIGGNLYKVSIDSIFFKTIKQKTISREIAIFQGIHYLLVGLGIVTSGYILHMNIPFQELIFYIGIIFLIFALISQTLPKNITTHFEILKYKSDIFQTKVLFFLFIVLLLSVHFGAENTSYGLFLEETLGLQKKWTGIYIGSAIFLMGIWAVIFSKLLKRIQVKSMLFIGLALSSIGHILMTIKEPMYSFAFRVLHEAGDAALFVFMAYGIASMFDIKRVGGNNSIVNFVMIIGATIGGLAFGPIGEKFGYDIPLIATGVVMFVALIMALIFDHYILEHKPETKTT